MKKTAMILFCMILACAAFTALAEAPAAENIPFATVGDAVTDTSFFYNSSEYYVILTEKDGAWWRVDAPVDEKYSEMYSGILDAPDPGAAFDEMLAYVYSMPPASAEKLSELPLSEAVLNKYTGKKMKDLLADGFEFDWAQGFTADESKSDGAAQILRPADALGTVYRLPFDLVYTVPEEPDGLIFKMNMGIYSYQFSFPGTEETLKKAIEDGTWEEMEIAGTGCFSGFSSDMEQSLWQEVNAPRFPTAEEAAAIRTVHDAVQYDYLGFYSENNDRFFILINGTDCFWLATAELDDRYRELSRAARSGEENAYDVLWEYETALPVTVEALENEHPPISDVSAYVGKTIGDLQADGFRIFWFYATTADPEKEEYNKTLFLPEPGGEEAYVSGYFSYDDYNEYCLMDMDLGMYKYIFAFDCTAETLEAAISDGTFLSLTVREADYNGISDEAVSTLLE